MKNSTFIEFRLRYYFQKINFFNNTLYVVELYFLRINVGILMVLITANSKRCRHRKMKLMVCKPNIRHEKCRKIKIKYFIFKTILNLIRLTDDYSNPESATDICKRIFFDIDEHQPDISELCRQLQMSSLNDRHHGVPIDSRTFTRPKKYTARPSLTFVINPEDGRPKLQRRLTTTISPTPNLISKLEELSKTNNKSVSGNKENFQNVDGADESMVELIKSNGKSKRQSLPASLYDRLQELKKANSSFKVCNQDEQNIINQRIQNEVKNEMSDNIRKGPIDIDLKNSHSARLSEIFKNIQDYYSDDNESFISLDEVSGFCDRLTLSTDQNTYSSIMREMEQHDICLFHRTPNDNKSNESRITIGGMEVPETEFVKNKAENEYNGDDNDLNRTYEINDEEPCELNNTFELKKNLSKQNVMNLTYDANKKVDLMDAAPKADVLKDTTPKKRSNRSSENIENNNYNKSYNVSPSGFPKNNTMNVTYDKSKKTLDENELNALHKEKYSTKLFDSREMREDDCMSSTSDHSYKSSDSNIETKPSERSKSSEIERKSRNSSTPMTGEWKKLDFDIVSPIGMGDGEYRARSNPSSRSHSPRKIVTPYVQEGGKKYRMPNLKQPLRVPQRELKLKPNLVRPAQNFKRPLSYARTSSEPSVPQKVENFQPAVNVPVLRPLEPSSVPSLTHMRPSSRTSGIPRPPTRLKQPQIRVNYSKK
ncbi:myosin heavy chain, clone, putative [Pediculus humanus corporis]|uniref:Myosin heavy chain, clone, putative n=1 Tax=Pediculus humanus subsp. corporis TaxID=121224 RepID=E0W2A0_PEDHC|nr:myosin heavy chain, clone, putative [Pediculus humanus corporis]EEB19756.1 myosin heavy chain, clone, putative [Pediculus humanus corporis]